MDALCGAVAKIVCDVFIPDTVHIIYEITKERITRDLGVKIVPKNTRPSDFYLMREICVPVQLYIVLLVNTN